MMKKIKLFFEDTRIRYIFLTIFVLVIIIGIPIILLLTKKNQEKPVPPPIIIDQTVPPVTYDQNNTNKMLLILSERPKISNNDIKIRSDLLTSIGNKSGILNNTNNYSLEYVKAPDEFMAQIINPNILATKTEVVLWLKSKGLSQDGICKLPLIFYLNNVTADKLRNSNQIFNPLPEGC